MGLSPILSPTPPHDPVHQLTPPPQHALGAPGPKTCRAARRVACHGPVKLRVSWLARATISPASLMMALSAHLHRPPRLLKRNNDHHNRHHHRHPPCLLLTVVLALLAHPCRPAEFKLTGRKAKMHSEAAAQDPGWHTRAHVLPLHPFTNASTSTPPPPLAYGGTLASFTYAGRHGGEEGALQLDSAEIMDVVAFARRQGVFATITNEDSSCPAVNDNHGDEAAAVPPPPALEILAARRLLCEVVMDGPLCEQVVHEVVFADASREEEEGQAGGSRRRRTKGWVKGPPTGTMVFLELQDHQHGRRHHLTVSRDSQDHLAVFQHSSFASGAATVSPAEGPLPDMVILSYNVWHNQPGAWLYTDPAKRWHKYWERLAHLAAFVWASGAHVVGLQEVRYDGTMGPPGQHSGMQHLLDLLAALDNDTYPAPPPFQAIYQPAMSFTAHQGHTVREEEGVALLSRFPIRRSAYMLLPRDFGDAQDGHQRVCLYAEIEPSPEGPRVGVYVTHLSLSAPMREAGVASILEWAAEQRGSVAAQVVLGDLNAEPHERSVQMLTEAFRDAWVEMHPVPLLDEEDRVESARIDESGHMQKEADRKAVARRRRKRKALEARHAQASFTFPTCQPVKRIDYVLFRGAIRPVEARLCGREATEESKDRDSPGGGMLEPDGPVFASDHLAVLARFEGLENE